MTRTLLAVALSGIVSFGLHGQSDSTINYVNTDTTGTLRPKLPVFTITADDLDAELGSQDISGILQSSRDIFTAVAGFTI